MNQITKKFVTTAKIAYRLTTQELPKDSHGGSTSQFELQQLAACVLIKVYLDLSYRAMEKWLRKSHEVRQVLGLSSVPDHTTLHKTYHKLQDLDFEKMKNQIIAEEEVRWKNYGVGLYAKDDPDETEQSPWLNRLVVIWLAGMVTLLPIKILNLPHNFELVDIWTLGGMPVMLYIYSLRSPRLLSLSYAIPMWFVLISSFISAFTSPAPTRSIIVIMKEVYLFVWFFVVLALLIQLNAKNMRAVLRAWSLVVICHGLLMVAQFLSPEVWQFTNALGGNEARYDVYRAAGLFICDKAGCANKAAFFQLLGFTPLLLAGYSKRTTIGLSIFLFASMMTSGSMGATLAFTAGLMVAIVTIAYLKKSMSMLVKIFLRIMLGIFILGGALYIVGSQNQTYLNHFERIIIGRFDKSSGGRFDLWGRGVDVLLEHQAFFWGVGPENFRIVDAAQTDNQLHNDTLAFLVERGMLGLTGLALFAAITLLKAVHIIQIFEKFPVRARIGVVVFLSMLAATIVESLTHQIFHTRELWLVLAVQEAVLYKMATSNHGIEPVVVPAQETAQFRPGLLARPEFIVDR